MIEKHTKTHENIYRNARLHASERNPLLSSMDTACDQVYISRRLLWEIETGTSVPSSNVVLAMSDVYESPELLAHFCAVDCPIGKARGFAPITGMSIEAVALNMISLLRRSEELVNTMVDAARDGVVDVQEMTKVQTVIDRITELNGLKEELLIAMERRGTR